MPKRVPQFVSNLPKAPMALPSYALWSVTSKSGKGVYASSDTLFKGAVFGRDSLEVADDLINDRPRLVRNILLTLAKLQGTTTNKVTEEELGKIIHEYRTTTVDGKKINKKSMEIFNVLSEKWGGSDNEMAYYGSVDATPHFIKTLAKYCDFHGRKILDKEIIRRDASPATVLYSVEQAGEWLLQKLHNSKSGLLEFKRTNPHGISNQVWKDSEEFYVHRDGELANHNAPIASIEVQGLTYDALHAAARLLPHHEQLYLEAAERLRARTFELLWLEDEQYFALGTDYKDGKMRIIKTRTANPAALLDSSIFDTLPFEQKKRYVSSIVQKIVSSDFMTDAGVRSRALSEAHVISFWDYHGSFVSWPKETYDIAKGLNRQGFRRLAHQLENRLINIFFKQKRYPEFVYIDEYGRVLSSAGTSREHGELLYIRSTNHPERVQAWTVSAIIAIMNSRVKQKIALPSRTKSKSWQNTLENKILAQMPSVNMYINPLSLSARYPTYRYKLSGKDGL